MSSTLTPTQQIHVSHALRFLSTPLSDRPAQDLGSAVVHIQRLLNIISDLTGDDTIGGSTS